MKHKLLIAAGAVALLGHLQPVSAQRERPNRQEQRQQRREEIQAMTPEQRQQYFRQRMEERLRNANPEQRQRMEQRRREMEQRLREAGIDPNSPDAWQQARERGLVGNRGGGQGGPGGEGGRGGRGGARPMSPQERDEARRNLMMAAGITDKEVQDAIIAFVNEREQSRAELLRLAREAAAALMAPPVQTVAEGEAAPQDAEQKVSEAFTAYQTALAEDRTAYAEALKELDTRIQFSQNPRLKAFLALIGVTEYDPLSFGGVAAIFVPQQPAENRQAQRPEGGEGEPAAEQPAAEQPVAEQPIP